MRSVPPVTDRCCENIATSEAYCGNRSGIFYKMQQAVPDKELLEAPTQVRVQPAAAARIVRGWP